MNQDEAVQELYERFPYPDPVDDVEPFIALRRYMTWNPNHSWSLYFPQEEKREDIQVLVAGCGTRAGFMTAACLPGATVTCVDISAASIGISQETCERAGLTNVEHIQLPLEEVASLGRDFDFIHCHGVLHHLADPVAGLKALGSVLRPEGAMSLMVYARYGRAGLYMLQELSQRLGLEVSETTAKALQEMCWLLPASHPFRSVGYTPKQRIAINEVLDMLAHPRDISYATDDVRDLIAGAGLKMHRWLGQAKYSPRVGPMQGSAIGLEVMKQPFWKRSATAELLKGNISKHSFIVTQPGRASAEELFGEDRILDAVPSLAAHLKIEQDDTQTWMVSGAHPPQMHAELRVVEEPQVIQQVLGSFGKGHTLRQILETQLQGGADPALEQWLPDFSRLLYEADLIDLASARG